MKTFFLLLFLFLSPTITLSMAKKPYLKTKRANRGLPTLIESPLKIFFVNLPDNFYKELAPNLMYNHISANFLMKMILEVIIRKNYSVFVFPSFFNIDESLTYKDSVKGDLIKIIFDNIPKQITEKSFKENEENNQERLIVLPYFRNSKPLNKEILKNSDDLIFSGKQKLLISSFNTNIFAYYFNNQKTYFYNNMQEVLIPSGVYSPFIARVENQHKFVKSFIVDKYPVTNFDFLKFVKENREWRRSLVPRVFADTSYLAHWSSDLVLSQFSDKNSPVTRVSWFAANAYCESLGKHLPTIDQWEYIAENKGLNADLIDDKILNWYLIPTSPLVPRLGNQEKNVYGISDVYASIWEWTEDFNSILTTQDSRANEERKNGPLFCGAGAIGLDPSRYIKFTRYSMRDSLRANYVVTSLGFRCVRQN